MNTRRRTHSSRAKRDPEPAEGHRLLFLLLLLALTTSSAQSSTALAQALTHHVSFDKESLTADYSTGDPIAYTRRGKDLIPAQLNNDELKIVPQIGRHGTAALWFPKKGTTRPQYHAQKILNYKGAAKPWSTTVSIWLRLDPDTDLEPGYCVPIQIVGDDNKKGYLFLEWSKDETPRYFRYAIRPLFHIWNPDNIPWADIPFAKRPMVQVERPSFTREKWTHVVFTVENVKTIAIPDANPQPQPNPSERPTGRLYLDGQFQGAIENWDLTIAWDPTQISLILGAAYVGYMDDLAVFNRALTPTEVQQLYTLKNGITDLHPK